MNFAGEGLGFVSFTQGIKVLFGTATLNCKIAALLVMFTLNLPKRKNINLPVQRILLSSTMIKKFESDKNTRGVAA